MAKLHAIAFNDEMPPQVQLEAIKHALKVTGAFEAKQSVEIDMIGKPREKTFEDFAMEALVDVLQPGDDGYEEDLLEKLQWHRQALTEDSNVIDAEVIEDVIVSRAKLSPDEPPIQNRHDRALTAEVAQSQRTRRPGAGQPKRPPTADYADLDAPTSDRPVGSFRSDDVEAMNDQTDHEEAEVERVKEAERQRNLKRIVKTPRNGTATMSTPTRRRQR
ncbi:hypothetical protein [Microbacterium pumilum]